MRYIEPHAHMVSRTTDDYEKLALAGCEALCEPAFWAGFDRSSADGFYDYFRQLTEYEPRRAARFGIKHFCWLCINPKEADDPGFAREVMALIPQFIEKENVLGIGEIGLNKNTRNELRIFEEHVQIALDHDLPILIHTPHLEDKLKGTKLILRFLGLLLQNRSIEGDHRSCGGTYCWRSIGCGILGRDDALSREQVHARPSNRYS